MSRRNGRGGFLKRWRQDVPLDDIRHDDKPCYRAEGVGGQPIERWPVYRFFSLYGGGRRMEAAEEFEAWYHQQFERYGAVPKRYGGMFRGSLYRTIELRHRERSVPVDDNPALFDPTIVASAVRERVQQRLSLFDQIAAQGYQTDRAEDIMAIRRSDGVYLRGGHHRAAILKALGTDQLPGLIVFPHRALYAVLRRCARSEVP